MRTKHERTLRDGRVLIWVHVWRRQACATPEDYNTDGTIDGEPISDTELRDYLLGRSI